MPPLGEEGGYSYGAPKLNRWRVLRRVGADGRLLEDSTCIASTHRCCMEISSRSGTTPSYTPTPTPPPPRLQSSWRSIMSKMVRNHRVALLMCNTLEFGRKTYIAHIPGFSAKIHDCLASLPPMAGTVSTWLYTWTQICWAMLVNTKSSHWCNIWTKILQFQVQRLNQTHLHITV